MRSLGVNTSVLDPWTELLRQARGALSSLRFEDLEDLAGRAECMLEATIGGGMVRQRMRLPQKEAMAGLTQERGLLRRLLVETDRNHRVLQRTRGDGGTCERSGEVDSRWVR